MKKLIFGGILTIVGLLNVNAQCKTVTSITENFDTWKDIDKCWTAQSGGAMLYASNKKITFYSMTTPKEKMYLITPKLKAGNYTLTLDVSDNGGETSLEIFSVGKTTDQKSFVSIVKPQKIAKDKKVININLKKESHVALKVLLNGIHQAVYVDNLSIKPKK